MEKFNPEVIKDELNAQADRIGQYIRSHELFIEVKRMNPWEVFHLLMQACSLRKGFVENVITPLGNVMDAWRGVTTPCKEPLFLCVRNEIVQIVEEEERLSAPVLDETESREFAKMQALAGWHHVREIRVNHVW